MSLPEAVERLAGATGDEDGHRAQDEHPAGGDRSCAGGRSPRTPRAACRRPGGWGGDARPWRQRARRRAPADPAADDERQPQGQAGQGPREREPDQRRHRGDAARSEEQRRSVADESSSSSSLTHAVVAPEVNVGQTPQRLRGQDAGETAAPPPAGTRRPSQRGRRSRTTAADGVGDDSRRHSHRNTTPSITLPTSTSWSGSRPATCSRYSGGDGEGDREGERGRANDREVDGAGRAAMAVLRSEFRSGRSAGCRRRRYVSTRSTTRRFSRSR